MTYKTMLDNMTATLAENGIAQAANDAWIIMSEVLKIDRNGYFMHMSDNVATECEVILTEYVSRRAKHEPLQYILGKAYFMGYEFEVTPDVLIPRFDTEVLVEQALKLVTSQATILDMCTGSGCIAISMALLAREAKVTAVDLSENALKVAKTNAKRLDASVAYIQSDMFDKVTGSYDLIVSNPPYIRTEVIAGLDTEVKDKEPFMALDGGDDGLVFYRILAKDGYEHLKEGGHIIMEIGYDQAAEVASLLEQNKFTDIKVIKDLAGLDRVVCGRRN